MVCVDHNRRVLKVMLPVHIAYDSQILVMIVRNRLSALVHIASENCVCIRIAVAGNFPVSVDKSVSALRRNERIHEDRKVSSRRVFHADCDVQSACRQAMELVFHRPCADSHITQNIT